MEGYFDNNSGILCIDVRNIPEFENLIKRAYEEAEMLRKTITELTNFELEVRVTGGSISDR